MNEYDRPWVFFCVLDSYHYKNICLGIDEFKKKEEIMLNAFEQLPNKYQGILYFGAGSVMLLYALGFIEKGITLIIVLFALYLIGVGCVKSGLYQKMMGTIKQVKK